MEDKQIIELYWNRSDDAIKETKQKYGTVCSYIANNILGDEVAAEDCVRECYQRLWDTIPPHKPRNLKGYLCKVTRVYALNKKYPAGEGQEKDLFSAELIIQDFVRGLELDQRKEFLARYWYFASVEEIALQYKMSESKVQKTLESLRQSLQELLEQKNVVLETEEAFLYAMTEMDDRYLEEAMPVQTAEQKLSEQTSDNVMGSILENIKLFMTPLRIKVIVTIFASVAVLVFIGIFLPGNTGNQPQDSSEIAGNSQLTEGTEETENSQQVPPVIENTDTDILEIINILRGKWLDKDTFAERKEAWPWKSDMEIATLPVYKNLMYGFGGESVYYDEDTLRAMVEDIATKLNMQEIGIRVDRTSINGVKNAVSRIDMTTDTGSIRIEGNGKVTISFLDGVLLPSGYEMSDSATTKQANGSVTYLLEKYADLLPEGSFIADSYAEYDYYGNRTMNYRAVEKDYGVDGIANYYFNQVNFSFNNQIGMTEISYGDMRTATEFVGYYPIISFEEAIQLLQDGKAIAHDEAGATHPVEKLPSFADVRGIELKYIYDDEMHPYNYDYAYYQPYYCFYVELDTKNEYCRYYVPAVKGVSEDGTPPQMEVTILDMSGYEKMDDVYFKDGKAYTLKNGEIVEAKDYDGSEDPFMEYGEVVGEDSDTGTEWILYYKDEPIVNLSRLTMPPDGRIGNYSLDAMYIEGQVVVFSILYPNSDSTQPLATVYLYSEEDQSLTPIMHSVPLYGHYQPQGLDIKNGRYATMGNEAGEVLIVDLLTGRSVNTGMRYDDIQCILSASDKYYAFVNKEGEIALIDKKSGKFFKRASYKLSFTPDSITYQDEMLYIPTDYGKQVFVIKDFEN